MKHSIEDTIVTVLGTLCVVMAVAVFVVNLLHYWRVL